MPDFPAAYQASEGSALAVDKGFYQRIADRAGTRTLVESRAGFCARHTNMRINREEFAFAILDGRFIEADLTDAEHEEAQRLGVGIDSPTVAGNRAPSLACRP